MPTYPLSILIPLDILALCLLAAVVFTAHRMRPTIGLIPLLVILGGIASVLLFPTSGSVKTEFAGVNPVLKITSFAILPTLLLGLLIVYIVEGSTQTRSILFGIFAIAMLATIYRIITSVEQPFMLSHINKVLVGTGMRELMATILALTADLTAMVMVYQWVSNVHKRYPSLPAIVAALLVALWIDALVFSTTSFLGLPEYPLELVMHLAGKTFAGFVLIPLVALYIRNYSQAFPSSIITSSRPVMDIFTTSLLLEARARYNYNLLQTLLKINHLVVRATNLQTLLEQACQLLVDNQEYLTVYILLTGSKPMTAWAGKNPSLILAGMVDEDGMVMQDTPAQAVLQSKKVLVIKQTSSYVAHELWAQSAQQHGVGSAMFFPMSLETHSLGIMMVGAEQEDAFDDDEVELLQELVNDLSNTIINYQLRQTQTTLITAAEMLPDGLLITELTGEILYANPVAANVMRVDEGELLGRNITSFLPSEMRQGMVGIYAQALSERGNLELEFDVDPPGEQKYSLSIRAALVLDPQHTPRQIVISVRDVTSRKLYEHQLLALNRLITDLVQRHTKEDLLPLVFPAAEELLNGWASAIYTLDAQGNITDFLPHNLPKAVNHQIFLDSNGLPGETIIHIHQPVAVPDVLNDTTYQERIHFLATYGIRALLLLPILDEERICATLAVYYNHPHAFTEEEIQLGMTLEPTISIALQNLHLYQAERSQRQLAEGLAQAAASLNRLLNPDEVLDQILQQAMQITACRSTNIILIQGMNVRLVRSRGYADTSDDPITGEHFPFPINIASIRRMIESGKPLLVSDVQDEAHWSPIYRTEWIRSYAGVPLKVSGQVVGFLNVDSDQPGAFSPDTIQRLQALADHASIAIHNAELYSESNRQAQELSALVQSAAMVSTSLNYNQVLEELSQQMARLVNVEGCAISVYDQATESVVLLAYYNEQPTPNMTAWQKPFKLSEYPMTRRVLQENIVIELHVDEPNADPAEIALMEAANVKTMLMLPLVVQEVTLGLVELESTDAARVFTPREIALLQTLGANAANAIQNAQLYTQLQEYAGQLEQRVEERTAELRSAMEHIESILASIPDAIFVLDDKFQPIRSNQAGDQLILNALSDELNLFEPDFLERLRSGRLPPEESILHARGRYYQALVSPFPIQPGLEGLIIVFRDVTRFRELDEIKSHFVSDVSHEFRTPLTNLILYLDLLSALEDWTKGKNYIDTLQRETQRLGFLIEDLLTISRLEAGRVTIAIKPTDINAIITDLVNDRTMLASSRELTLTFIPDLNLVPALTDANLLNQAVSNLLTNAINYTPSGGSVTLSTHLVEADGAHWVTIDIADTGVGISAEEQTRIFERFYRGTASRLTGAAGTGLGLAIAQEIAQRLNGKLSVKSQVGLGSTFTFWLKAVL